MADTLTVVAKTRAAKGRERREKAGLRERPPEVEIHLSITDWP